MASLVEAEVCAPQVQSQEPDAPVATEALSKTQKKNQRRRTQKKGLAASAGGDASGPKSLSGAENHIAAVPEGPPFDPSPEESLNWEVRFVIFFIKRDLESECLDEKMAKETLKHINEIASPKTPLVRRRAVMRMRCGDYRKEMKQWEPRDATGMEWDRCQQPRQHHVPRLTLDASVDPQENVSLVMPAN